MSSHVGRSNERLLAPQMRTLVYLLLLDFGLCLSPRLALAPALSLVGFGIASRRGRILRTGNATI
jgi:hypothetical protein